MGGASRRATVERGVRRVGAVPEFAYLRAAHVVQNILKLEELLSEFVLLVREVRFVVEYHEVADDIHQCAEQNVVHFAPSIVDVGSVEELQARIGRANSSSAENVTENWL